MTDEMSTDESLRGSTPIYTAKDVLVRVDAKIDTLDGKVDGLAQAVAVILSQDLGKRVGDIESWQNRVIGMASTARVLGVISTLLGIVAVAWQVIDKIAGA